METVYEVKDRKMNNEADEAYVIVTSLDGKLQTKFFSPYYQPANCAFYPTSMITDATVTEANIFV